MWKRGAVLFNADGFLGSSPTSVTALDLGSQLQKVPSARALGMLWRDAASRLPAVSKVVDHLELSPDAASVALGQTQAFTVTVYDSAGRDLGPDPNAKLSISPDGSCKGDKCTATAAGTYTVTATDGSATGTASLTVSPTFGWPTGFTAHYDGQFTYNPLGLTLGGDVTVTFFYPR